MSSAPIDTVLAWLDAVNAGNTESALEHTISDVSIVGPRGAGRGREVLRAWLSNVGAKFVTRAVYGGGDSAVVAQRGVWRDAATGAIRGEADVATRFRVIDGKVAEIQRYDDLLEALRDAGLTPADVRP